MTDEQFECLAAKYIDTVYRVTLSWLRNRADAEDATQQTLLKLYREKKAFASEDHVKHWLIRVAINECKRMARNPFRIYESIEEHLNDLRFEEPGQSEVYSEVMGLPQKYRVPIFLYYYEGYSTAEISELLGIPAPTVATRLSRGREKLRIKLQEERNHA